MSDDYLDEHTIYPRRNARVTTTRWSTWETDEDGRGRHRVDHEERGHHLRGQPVTRRGIAALYLGFGSAIIAVRFVQAYVL